jgi:hypothetical protein
MWTIAKSMNLVPRNNSGKIQFFKGRLEQWADRAVEIGTSDAAVADLSEKTAIARQAYMEQQAAIQAARAATLRLNNAIDDMASAGASIIMQIKSKARLDGNEIYSEASISPPDKRSPIAEPGKPYMFTTNLDQIGILTLKWKCDNPRGSKGTMYQVFRQIVPMGGSPGKFEYIGKSGTKKFVDSTIPMGAGGQITYQVQAIRSTKSGPAAFHTVNFGVTDSFIRMMQQRIQHTKTEGAEKVAA